MRLDLVFILTFVRIDLYFYIIYISVFSFFPLKNSPPFPLWDVVKCWTHEHVHFLTLEHFYHSNYSFILRCALCSVFILFFFFKKKKKKREKAFDTYCVWALGLSIALSFPLSYIVCIDIMRCMCLKLFMSIMSKDLLTIFSTFFSN